MGRYYFLASSLPPMPLVLGEKLPLSFSDISRLVLRNIESSDEPLVRCCLQKTDTANMEYALQGQNIFLSGGTLSQDEIENRSGLPYYLRSLLDDTDRVVRPGYRHDNLWEGYYDYAYSLAQAHSCRFLVDYLSWEIGLRNSLVVLRAKAFDKEPEDHLVMARVGIHDFSTLLSQVKMQQNPLKAEQLIDEERLKRIFHCEGADPFSLDAILACLEKARIYDRWEKISETFHVTDLIGDGGSNWNRQ